MNTAFTVTADLSIVVLTGWGLLVMAITFRAFAWLGRRAVGRRGGGMGLVRLLVGVSSLLLLTLGARVIASLLHRSQSISPSLVAAAAFLVYRGLRDTRRNMTLTRPLPVGDLGRALGVQVALLPLYGFYAFVGAAASPSSPSWYAFALMGFMWLLVASLLIIWWGEGRVGLIRRALIWGAVAWLTVFILPLMPWERSRRLLVPAPSAWPPRRPLGGDEVS